MDIIDRHFAAENAHDVDATLATYTDDIVWDDVTHPLSPFEGKEAVGAVYSGDPRRDPRCPPGIGQAAGVARRDVRRR